MVRMIFQMTTSATCVYIKEQKQEKGLSQTPMWTETYQRYELEYL